MSYLVDLPRFIIPLGNEAREQAKKFQSYQPDSQHAKQVYLNTLAIYATSFYLEMLDFETDLVGSDSWNPAMQVFMDGADLNLPGLGKLECVPISPKTKVAHVPFDALEDRIGYVIVQVNEQGTEAIIWGFANKVESEEFSLEGLRAIEELREYLQSYRTQSSGIMLPTPSPILPLKPIPRNLIDQWRDQWRAARKKAASLIQMNERFPENLGEPSYTTASAKTATVSTEPCSSETYRWEIDIGKGKTVILDVTSKKDNDEFVRLQIEVRPKFKPVLPPKLELVLRSSTGETLVTPAISVKKQSRLQLAPYLREFGEQVHIQITFAGVSQTIEVPQYLGETTNPASAD